MALSKPNTSLMAHLRTLAKPYRRVSPSPSPSPPSFVSLRFLSFASPEDAAAERRRRKRRLRIEPPLSSLHRSQQQAHPQKPQNPNAPKIPEHVSALTGNRLNLHNKILTLIRENDLDEAALYTRHSIYSNCKPTIFTVNSVLNALLRQCKYSDLLSLHRFITQAGVAPNVITHNLVFQTYLDCRKPDTAMEHYKQMINDAPFNPSPTTYRILVKGLVDNGKLGRALELKDEMIEKGFAADPTVYHYLMTGCARNSDSDEVLRLFDELKEKLGGFVEDGVVYGSLMKGYFMKGMEKEAMECYEEVSSPKVKMSAVAYSSVLDALSKNGKFDEALKLFDRILSEHDPPRHLKVNLGCFNVVSEGYCAQGRFDKALNVFRKMGNYKCTPDTLSFNVLIDQLCSNGLLSEAEKLYGEMDGKGVSPDEFTFTVLMDTCFKENRPDDASGYFSKMVDSKLRPNLAVYNRLVDELVKVGKVEEAKSFFDLMVKKLKMDVPSYKFIMKVLSEAGKLDEVLSVVDALLDEEDGSSSVFGDELREFVEAELRKEGREEDLGKLISEKARQKAEAKAKEEEAAEATKNRARAAVSSLLPSKLFGPKEPESAPAEAEIVTETENKGSGDSGLLSESSSSSESEAVKSEISNNDAETASNGDEASK